MGNSIKFTGRGGEICVKAKYIQSAEDLTYKDARLLNSMEAASHGGLEIQVTDNGIGISQENQSKLFKLFGFIKDS